VPQLTLLVWDAAGGSQNTPVCFEFGGAGVLCGFADMEENQDTIKRSACGIGKSGAE
jgi:hypothetical protein